MGDNIIEIINKDYIFEILQNSYEISVEHVFSMDYNLASNIPSINNVKLIGNKSLSDLGVQSEGSYSDTDLSNLSADGENHFLNRSLSNLDSAGQAILAAKADSATTLNGYGITDGANISASNFNSAGENFLAKLGFPSSRYIDLTFGASGTNYIAPSDGYIYLQTTNNSNSPVFAQLSNSNTGITSQNQLSSSFGTLTLLIYVFRSDSFVLNYSNNINCQVFKFIYAQGVQ